MVRLTEEILTFGRRDSHGDVDEGMLRGERLSSVHERVPRSVTYSNKGQKIEGARICP